MIVRPGGPADVPALAALRGIPADNLPGYAAWVAGHADTHLPFVAEVDGVLVGVAWLFVAERVPSRNTPLRRFGDIQAVEVREEFRNRGIGSALLAAILAEAAARNLLHVTVHSGRRAVEFYQRAGFVQHRQFMLWKPQ